MAKNVTVRSNNVGFLGLLAILFIGLKLTGHIDWSWWWVLSPFWAPLAVLLAIAGMLLLGALVFGIDGAGDEKK